MPDSHEIEKKIKEMQNKITEKKEVIINTEKEIEGIETKIKKMHNGDLQIHILRLEYEIKRNGLFLKALNRDLLESKKKLLESELDLVNFKNDHGKLSEEEIKDKVLPISRDDFEVTKEIKDEVLPLFIFYLKYQIGDMDEAMKKALPKIFNDAQSFILCLGMLGPEERGKVFNAMGGRLPEIIKSAEDISNCLRYLDVTQCSDVCKAMGGRLPEIIKSAEDISSCLRYLDEKQRGIILDSMEKILKNYEKNKNYDGVREAVNSYREAIEEGKAHIKLDELRQAIKSSKSSARESTPEQSGCFFLIRTPKTSIHDLEQQVKYKAEEEYTKFKDKLSCVKKLCANFLMQKSGRFHKDSAKVLLAKKIENVLGIKQEEVDTDDGRKIFVQRIANELKKSVSSTAEKYDSVQQSVSKLKK